MGTMCETLILLRFVCDGRVFSHLEQLFDERQRPEKPSLTRVVPTDELRDGRVTPTTVPHESRAASVLHNFWTAKGLLSLATHAVRARHIRRSDSLYIYARKMTAVPTTESAQGCRLRRFDCKLMHNPLVALGGARIEVEQDVCRGTSVSPVMEKQEAVPPTHDAGAVLNLVPGVAHTPRSLHPFFHHVRWWETEAVEVVCCPNTSTSIFIALRAVGADPVDPTPGEKVL